MGNRGQEDELDVPGLSIKVDHKSRQGISKLLHSMWSLNREGGDYEAGWWSIGLGHRILTASLLFYSTPIRVPQQPESGRGPWGG